MAPARQRPDRGGPQGGVLKVHLLSVPNTQTTAAYYLDGFAQRTILFAKLLTRMGHEVVLYGVEENEAPCDQFVSCLTKKEQAGFIGETPYQCVPFEMSSPLFMTFNTRAAHAIRGTKSPSDIIATIAGSAQHAVWEQNPELRFLEYSIGYRGITAPYRVFQSHVWRHVVHGYTGVDGGREFDAVIPPWFDANDFPFEQYPGDYVLYCGRIVPTKGIKTVCESARAAGVRLLVLGHGDTSLITYGDYLGEVPTDVRNRLMSKARAVLMPTQYIEPFGNVAAEAQLCGTPVIATDYGAFVESVVQGETGYRCHTLGEFVQAIDLAKDLDRLAIRLRAVSLYGTDAARRSYGDYFRRLDLVGKDGWNDLGPGFRAPVNMRDEYATYA